MAENQDDRPPRNTPRKTHVRRFWRYEGGGWTPRGYNKGEKDEDVWVDVQRIDEISTKSGQGERYQITKIKLNWYDSDGVTENTTRATSMAKVRNPDDPDTFIEVPLIDKSRIRERGVIYDRETKRPTLGPQHRNFVIRNETDELPLTEDTTRQVKRRKVINREIINDMEPDEDGFFSEPYVYKNISDPGMEDEDQRAIVEQIDRAKMNWGMGGPSGQETQGLSGVTDILRQEYLEEVTRDLEDNVDQKAAPARLDAFQNIVNVNWGGAVEIPDAKFFPAPAAVTNSNATAPHANALSISGWVWVPVGTESAQYPLMVFGGDSSGDTSTVTATVGLDGRFTINVTFTGVPFDVDPLVGDYPGYDYYGWFQYLDPIPVQPGGRAAPVELGPLITGIAGLCGSGSFTVAPPAGCFRVPTSEAVLGQRVTMGSGEDTLAPNEWHHFIASCDTGGQPVWGDQLVGAFMFVNGQNVVEYFDEFFGLKLASQFGLPDDTTFEEGTGIAIKGRPAAIPRPSSQVEDWPQTPIRFCDWQVYPRLINPYDDIGNFIRIQKGVRKRVKTRIAEELYGKRSGNPVRKRAMWLFTGGGGSFHKSGDRAWGGNFIKTGKIKTVKPPPLARLS